MPRRSFLRDCLDAVNVQGRFYTRTLYRIELVVSLKQNRPYPSVVHIRRVQGVQEGKRSMCIQIGLLRLGNACFSPGSHWLNTIILGIIYTLRLGYFLFDVSRTRLGMSCFLYARLTRCLAAPLHNRAMRRSYICPWGERGRRSVCLEDTNCNSEQRADYIIPY